MYSEKEDRSLPGYGAFITFQRRFILLCKILYYRKCDKPMSGDCLGLQGAWLCAVYPYGSAELLGAGGRILSDGHCKKPSGYGFTILRKIDFENTGRFLPIFRIRPHPGDPEIGNGQTGKSLWQQ